LLRLSLRPDGRLANSPLLAATARAALLADLAEHGALTSGPAGLELDTTPTGFGPADRLLAGVAAQPDHTLEWWVRRGPDSIRDLGAYLLGAGLWIREEGRSRFWDTEPAGVRADAARLRAVLDGAAADTPCTAVLAALLGVIGTDALPGGQHPTDSDLAACGRAQWLMGDLVDYLLARRRLLAAAADDARISLLMNSIP
jgi:hypothetical protein